MKSAPEAATFHRTTPGCTSDWRRNPPWVKSRSDGRAGKWKSCALFRRTLFIPWSKVRELSASFRCHPQSRALTNLPRFLRFFFQQFTQCGLVLVHFLFPGVEYYPRSRSHTDLRTRHGLHCFDRAELLGLALLVRHWTHLAIACAG